LLAGRVVMGLPSDSFVNTVCSYVPFDWDSAKNAANIAKHGISFEDAARIFDGPVLERIDMRRDYGEVRIIAFGVAEGIELAVIYTWRGPNRRIISARRAQDRERKTYREVYPEQPTGRKD